MSLDKSSPDRIEDQSQDRNEAVDTQGTLARQSKQKTYLTNCVGNFGRAAEITHTPLEIKQDDAEKTSIVNGSKPGSVANRIYEEDHKSANAPPKSTRHLDGGSDHDEPEGQIPPDSGIAKYEEPGDEPLSEGESVESVKEFVRAHISDYRDMDARRKLAKKRIKQYHQYTNIVQERLSILESRCDWLDERAKKPGFDKTDDKPEIKKRNVIAKVNPQLWNEFKASPLAEAPHAIDVLIGEPEYSNKNVSEPWRRAVLLELLSTEKIEGEPGLAVPRIGAKVPDLNQEVKSMRGNRMPERIRFNSIALQHLLRRYFHSSAGNSYDASSFVDAGAIMLRPFKALMYFEADIRVLRDELFAILDNMKTKGGLQQRSQPDQISLALEERVDENREVENTPKQHETKQCGKEESKDPPTSDSQYVLDDNSWSQILKDLGLYHCLECCKLVAADWSTDAETRETFDCLIEMMDTYIIPVASRYRQRATEKVRFSDLWHLFRTGDEIIVNESAKSRNALVMRILRTNGGRRQIHPDSAPLFDSAPSPQPEDQISPVNGIQPFCIHAYYLSSNGTSLTPVRKRFVIPPYVGERPLTEFEVFPIECAIGFDSTLKERLVHRGKDFVRYTMSSSECYCDCKGGDLATGEELNDKVIVDPKEFYHSHAPLLYTEPEAMDLSETNDCYRGRDCSAGGNCDHSTTKIINDQHTDKTAMRDHMKRIPIFEKASESAEEFANNMKAEDFALCDYRVPAYRLRSREWVQVHVDDLDDASLIENSKGFDRLVLPPTHKHIIKSQVKEHFRKKRMRIPAAQDNLDLVRGKGQGLIILLHGAPGVGKTCTAETIADLVRKPLYPITCGDLGSTAREVEENLRQHFTLASKWDCVMLLDEADVFLAKRRNEDLDRNSIVSVFLRIMEYYKGLLFLTTNRVGTFDEAFKSRVHISLFYPNFDKETTVEVWETFIAQTKEAIEKKGWKHFEIQEDRIRRFAEKHWKENPDARWNGRQIRNAFHTAIAMAEFDAQGQCSS
ncbi:MAG: hypothetical protein M1820_008917 [Bogoriella megaspora]|nr:MAG: hypothetical protein M1820_008917 [Bogoriella megaspora]